jgi:hypothetical protein
MHNAVRVARDDVEARERVAQYIIRNAFSVANILYNDKTGTVIYKAKMSHGRRVHRLHNATYPREVVGLKPLLLVRWCVTMAGTPTKKEVCG